LRLLSSKGGWSPLAGPNAYYFIDWGNEDLSVSQLSCPAALDDRVYDLVHAFIRRDDGEENLGKKID
jgi:hypothetical protein